MPMIFGEAVSPATTPDAPRLPKGDKRARPNFRLMAHPDNWYWDVRVKEWLPDLARMVISGGVGGVALVNGKEDDTLARAQLQKKRWVIIENGDQRLADVVPRGEYLTSWLAHGHERSRAYGCVWEGYEWVRGVPEWGENHDLKVKFLRALVAKGIVPPMSPKDKEVEIRVVRNRVRRLTDQIARTPQFPSLHARLKAAEELLADLEADLAGKPAGGAESAPPPNVPARGSKGGA